MGCASRLTFSWGGNPGRRLAAPAARRGRARLAAAARARRAHARRHGGRVLRRARRACRSGCCAATSAPTSSRPTRAIRSVECPYTGERLATVPAINPDVTILHAQRADREGNVALARHRRRAARGGARRAHAGRHGRGDRRDVAARDELDRAAALGGERRGALPGRRLPRLRAGLLRAATTRSTSAGTTSRASATASRRGCERHVLGSRDHASSSRACGGARA